jgi:hypothetical protein
LAQAINTAAGFAVDKGPLQGNIADKELAKVTPIQIPPKQSAVSELIPRLNL